MKSEQDKAIVTDCIACGVPDELIAREEIHPALWYFECMGCGDSHFVSWEQFSADSWGWVYRGLV